MVPAGVRAVVAAAALLGVGCGSEERTPGPAGGLRVAVSILPQVEFVERLAGEHAQVTVMLPPGANPHVWEPPPSRLAQLSGVQVYARVGAGLAFEQAWMDRLTAMNPQMRVIDCGEGIEVVNDDPHIWLSPANATAMVENLCRGLAEVDPGHRPEYERNRAAYLLELQLLEARIAALLQGMPQRAFMVYHPDWGYFARRYGLEQIAVEQEGKEPTARGLLELTRQARERRIRVVFTSPQVDSRSARAVAQEIGARLVQLDPLAAGYAANLEHVAQTLAAR
ncbi:MAG: zinc ABC transporter substrate-binding protein [Candidatus Latescibacterota bacterium]